MALNGNTEGSAMKTAADSAVPTAGTPVTSAQLVAWWQAVATANVSHFTGSAVVNPGSFTNSGGAVTGTGSLS